MIPLHLPRTGLVQFGSLPQGPSGGELILLVSVRGGLWVPVGEVSRAHSPVGAPLLLGHVEGGQPLPLSLGTAGQAVEGDPRIFHCRVTAYDAVTGHSQLPRNVKEMVLTEDGASVASPPSLWAPSVIGM